MCLGPAHHLCQAAVGAPWGGAARPTQLLRQALGAPGAGDRACLSSHIDDECQLRTSVLRGLLAGKLGATSEWPWLLPPTPKVRAWTGAPPAPQLLIPAALHTLVWPPVTEGGAVSVGPVHLLMPVSKAPVQLVLH